MRRFRVLISAGAAAMLCAHFARAPGRCSIPGQAGARNCSDGIGRSDRSAGAHARAKAERELEALLRRRKSPGRGLYAGLRHGRQGRARRLYTDGKLDSADFRSGAAPDLPNDPLKDFAPIALVSKAPFLLLAHPALPVKSTRDLIALAKSKPDAINMGIANGSTTHMVSAWFISLAHIKLTLISYKGTGQVTVDTIAGQIHTLFGNVLATLPYVKAGRLRALAVSTVGRSSVLPELPTIDESGVSGFDVSTWHGWLAPAGTRPRSSIN